MKTTRKNDEAVSPVIGVILMVATTVILAAVIAAFVFGMSGTAKKAEPLSHNETITIIEKQWNGDSGNWGHVTTSIGEAYHVADELDNMRFQVNHTYNVEIDTLTWNFPAIVKINYEVNP